MLEILLWPVFDNKWVNSQNFFPVILSRVHNEFGGLHGILWHVKADPRGHKLNNRGQLFLLAFGGIRFKTDKTPHFFSRGQF